MSSPLDGRIRKLAREEATTLLGVATPEAPDLKGLQQQITDLHERLHHAAITIARLEARVGVLEKASSASEQAKTVSRRTAARKETSE